MLAAVMTEATGPAQKPRTSNRWHCRIRLFPANALAMLPPLLHGVAHGFLGAFDDEVDVRGEKPGVLMRCSRASTPLAQDKFSSMMPASRFSSVS